VKLRVSSVALALAVLALAGVVSPWVLRHTPFFNVRQVELIGVRHHSPEQLLEALELAPDRNLFESHRDVEERASALPGVIFAKAKRRMPATLKIEVVERLPVAFVPTSSGLLALDSEANPLTYDPTENGLDLPIVESADSVLARILAAVWTVDSGFHRQVDAARLGDGDMVVLQVGTTEVLLRQGSTTEDIRAVELVRRHLQATGRRYDELDARFEGRVIVRGSGV